MIELYEHNQQAYNLAVDILAQTKKAAIIHPTGTGKSFIGFKLCEDNKESRICWLSPSEYIFSTQLDNLRAVTGEEPSGNIQFLTYAKLMLMKEEEIRTIEPDYIVFDEYHRAGAPFWKEGVDKLLMCYPDIPILGLSATNIRYLDNRRDMAEELFDGHIASEITLGDAIVRGILNPPKYVLSMYQYQKSLMKYERRIKKVKNKIVKDSAEKCLEELRRKLEKADGLDEIFAKHMIEPHGKYIVFCANKEHMDEMMQHKEWFLKIDKEPHVYSVYSNDSSAKKIFIQFKEDEDKEHLRLLYCIDALNEGVHVENISGVILLRPTISPVVYKQQIGRALSASKKTNAVIFDIVMNIENLYSIGAVEEEMEAAATYYHFLGESQSIINERFEIIDEVRECRELFEKLNDTLTASWDMYYECAKKYYEENGNLNIPARYVTEEGYALGNWIFNQKSIRCGNIQGKLSEEQVQKLDQIGMIWELYSDLNWTKNFTAAKRYYEEKGNLNVPVNYKTREGIALGNWINSIRTWKKSEVHKKYLTDKRIKELESIGMIWSVLDYYWEQNYMCAMEYYKENGNLNVPSRYKSKDGILLGSWIYRQRCLRNGKAKGTPLSEEQIQRLNAIGMIWNTKVESKWESAFKEAKIYSQRNNNLLVSTTYTTENGFNLGTWIQRQRLAYRQGKLSKERVSRLEAIGMVWKVVQSR